MIADVVHRLVGYDRQTDRMKVKFDIPGRFMPEVKKIAEVLSYDTDAAWSYPHTKERLRSLASLIGVRADPSDAEFY